MQRLERLIYRLGTWSKSCSEKFGRMRNELGRTLKVRKIWGWLCELWSRASEKLSKEWNGKKSSARKTFSTILNGWTSSINKNQSLRFRKSSPTPTNECNLSTMI